MPSPQPPLTADAESTRVAARPLRVALYGNRAHQIQRHLVDHPLARLVAMAGVPESALPPALENDGSIRRHASLEELAADQEIDLVSVASPRCVDQAADVATLLRSGKHVYAEKPSAMSEHDLDRLLELSQQHQRQFREMAGTAFDAPYLSVRKLIQAGELGEIIQVVAQKSYPMFERRPTDEDVDGGLLLQVGVHGVRMVEHVGGLTIRSIEALETQHGKPKGIEAKGQLKTACSFHIRAESGALASVVANYCNPKGVGRHGNEMLRIFGERGFVEVTDGGTRTRLVTDDTDHGEVPGRDEGVAYHELYFRHLLLDEPMPLTAEQELHPLRMLLRCRGRERRTL